VPIRRALRKRGLFVFTVFANRDDDDGFNVGPIDGYAQGGCYVHGRNYIARIAEESKFIIEVLDCDVHEVQQVRSIMGLVVALRRS
jgi:predicted TPR repeat methyltransferase